MRTLAACSQITSARFSSPLQTSLSRNGRIIFENLFREFIIRTHIFSFLFFKFKGETFWEHRDEEDFLCLCVCVCVCVCVWSCQSQEPRGGKIFPQQGRAETNLSDYLAVWEEVTLCVSVCVGWFKKACHAFLSRHVSSLKGMKGLLSFAVTQRVK